MPPCSTRRGVYSLRRGRARRTLCLRTEIPDNRYVPPGSKSEIGEGKDGTTDRGLPRAERHSVTKGSVDVGSLDWATEQDDVKTWTQAAIRSINDTLNVQETVVSDGERSVTETRDAPIVESFQIVSGKNRTQTAKNVDASSEVKTSTLLKFAISTVGIYLASPLMSLIDTSAVGTCDLPVCLAALGPASILCDYAFYINTWIGVAMTNLHARAVADKDAEGSQNVVRTGNQLALATGVIVTGLVQVLAPWLILAYSGTVGNEILPHALAYMRVRALGFPAALITMSAQASLLASK
eukprot:CAMPEP_0167805338 /NCGR_PEP_ID=MMETSP0111_2-20121227/21117_1 /TAXON_ID=91324 /ORGANISM="Lotharella globosa, Strain CCCM811" /LENGTH=295 /DNA_ID=CAMNT_0007702469 /DNA_START=52 /DNA_END=936 /DNA_ORIENTATION=+